METRGVKNKQLIEILKVAGMYEEGMEVEEMRQMAQAIEMSAVSYDSVECFNVERALLESETEFQMLANSTMIVQPPMSPPHVEVFDGAHNFTRDCDSPPSEPIQMQVQAIVHHELNWSPTQTGRPLKREASAISLEMNTKRPHQAMGSQAEADATPISHSGIDSGVSCDEIGSLSSVSDTSTLPSIGEMPSQLLISTSSVAVSDSSSRNHSSQLEYDSQLDT